MTRDEGVCSVLRNLILQIEAFESNLGRLRGGASENAVIGAVDDIMEYLTPVHLRLKALHFDLEHPE